jgi:hypothetical protein
MRASELAALIGGTDKSNNQLEDDSKRGRGSGRKRQWQQQHGRAPAVNLRCLQRRWLVEEVNGNNVGYGDSMQRQAVAVAAALAAAVLTGSYGGGGGLWRRRKGQRQQSRVILCLC